MNILDRFKKLPDDDKKHLTLYCIYNEIYNLKNINIEDDECYVQLDFLYDKDIFTIIRVATPKSDLKIFKNESNINFYRFCIRSFSCCFSYSRMSSCIR